MEDRTLAIVSDHIATGRIKHLKSHDVPNSGLWEIAI